MSQANKGRFDSEIGPNVGEEQMKMLEITGRLLLIVGYVGKCAVCHGPGELAVTVAAAAGVLVLNSIGIAMLFGKKSGHDEAKLIE